MTARQIDRRHFLGSPVQAEGVRVYGTSVNLRGAKSAKHQLTDYPYAINIEERCSCA